MASIKELASLVSQVVGNKVDKDRMAAFKKVGIEAHKGGCGCAGCKNQAVNNANYWLDDEAITTGIDRGYRFMINRKGDIVRRANPNEQGNSTEQQG